jgi:hypothetical protein
MVRLRSPAHHQRRGRQDMSVVIVFGIVVIAVSAIAVAIVTVMFVWGAREDGRDQKRTDARVEASRRRSREDL